MSFAKKTTSLYTLVYYGFEQFYGIDLGKIMGVGYIPINMNDLSYVFYYTVNEYVSILNEHLRTC